MKIEIGKEYRIRPLNKKSYWERELWVDTQDKGQHAVVESVWRGGTWIVRIEDDNERQMLEDMICPTAEGEMSPDEFNTNEFIESYDGTSNAIDVFVDDDYEHSEQDIIDGYDEHGMDWFWDNGWDSDGTEFFLELPLVAEEIDEDNRYNL